MRIRVTLLGLCVAFFTVTTTHAQELQVEVAENAVNTEPQVFARVGNTVTSAGRKYKRDTFWVGRKVEIDGVFEKDVLIIGGDVQVSGIVLGDVRVLGGRAQVDADIYGSLSVLGGSVTVSPSAHIHEDTGVLAGKAAIYGITSSQNRLLADRVLLGGQSDGDWQITAGGIKILPDFRGQGDIRYRSPWEAVVDPSASISGVKTRFPTVLNLERVRLLRDEQESLVGWFFMVGRIFEAGLAFILGIGGLVLYKKQLEDMATVMDSNFFHVAAKGLLLLGLAVCCIVVLGISLVGIPLAVIFGLLMIGTGIIAQVVASYWLGKKVFSKLKRKPLPLLSFTLGLVLFLTLGYLPFLSFLFQFVVLSAAFGMIYLYVRKDFPTF